MYRVYVDENTRHTLNKTVNSLILWNFENVHLFDFFIIKN